ncbi:MAG: glycoside hydrolase [candidate division Zixibacteria bacterium]|nr:glycoside hydrolase [candidate division Zixibacteria bacterium]MCI0597095.1 glycoside hydrolase [candidate division Zixibacteria bacterium]
MRKGILAAVASLILSAGKAEAQPNIYTFPGPDVDLGQSSNARVVSGGHYIGGRGDTVYVLRQFEGTLCHKSTDGGRTFGPGVLVNSTFGAVNASLRVDTAGIVYVAYQSSADIYFTKSTDGGQTFISAVKVNDDNIPTVGQSNPVIAVNNKGQIFVAWNDRRTNPWSVFSSVSYNGGATFIPNIQVNEAGTAVGESDIAADDSGRVYIVYDGTTSGQAGVVYARSDDSGQNIIYHALASDLPVDSTAAFAQDPSLTIFSNGLVGVAWWDGRNDSVTLRFSVSDDLGQTFSPSVIVDKNGYPQFPSVLCENGLFYISWRATHRRTHSGPELNHIWFSYSRDSGKSFVPFKDAAPDTNIAPHFWPSIWVNENEKVFVAWTDPRWDPFWEDHHLYVSVGKPLLSKGDLNFDATINLVDIGLEINAVFLGQPFPAPFHRADGNCDGRLTPADMVILLNRWYRGIPFPCE